MSSWIIPSLKFSVPGNGVLPETPQPSFALSNPLPLPGKSAISQICPSLSGFHLASVLSPLSFSKSARKSTVPWTDAKEVLVIIKIIEEIK